MKKLNTKKIRSHKLSTTDKSLQMLTCYDFQTAQMFNTTDVDLLLVGDSLGNVILGYDTTIEVELRDMITFTSAVKRGAPNKFVVADMPFGTYTTFEDGVKNGIELFKQTKAESVKLEGAYPHHIEIIQRLTQSGVPVMGHIGLTPQSVHELGGYYTHGKDDASKNKLIEEALKLQAAGCFCIVLECVKEEVATEITRVLDIPTIGIGSGALTDGQVLVTNDLLHMGATRPPKFCTPIANFHELKKSLISEYLEKSSKIHKSQENVLHN
jgi:3-methyl-2-oxobutanoate hydroxymethyltransferase